MAININNPPETKPERIYRLLHRIDTGDIKIPVFQRKYVWKPDQVIELLDSIYLGYPIGSFLFWLTDQQLATERDLGEFSIPPTPEKYPRNYILDGQQRLATIYGVLRWQGKPEQDHIFNVCFDLIGRKFLRDTTGQNSTQLPLNIVFEPARFRAFQNSLLSRPDSGELIRETEVLAETLREYSIPVVTVSELSMEHVSLIFERINSTGTKLTLYDLMIAATWSDKFDLRGQVDRILEELATKDFDDISPVAILQALAIQVTGSAKRASVLELRYADKDALSTALAKLRESLRRAVDFLINEVNVKSSAFLPYERQLTAMTHAFSNRASPSAVELENLRKWFWRTSFSERYRRGGEGLFDEDLSNVVLTLSDSSLLESLGVLPDTNQIRLNQFRRNSALSNAFVALLAIQGPRNLLNGSSIDTGKALSSYNRKEFHHIFPQRFLRDLGVTTSRISSLANICMLSADQNKTIGDSAPSKYVREMQSRLGDDFLPVLASNLIPEDCVDSLLTDNFDEFVDARARHIAMEVTRVAL